jgi:hypothetical protein
VPVRCLGPPSARPLQRAHAPVRRAAGAGVQRPHRGRPARRYLALSDNGYGAKANSADFLLRAHRLQVDFASGTVDVRGTLEFSDPRGLAGQPLTRADRRLTGADFDPESIRRVADGTYWVGEEFGPALLHFSASGELLSRPCASRCPSGCRRTRGPGAGHEPDAPELAVAHHRRTDGVVRPPLVPGPDAAQQANLPGSRGIEGMALSTDGRTLYPSLEGALFDDLDQRRRVVYAFDLSTAAVLPGTPTSGSARPATPSATSPQPGRARCSSSPATTPRAPRRARRTSWPSTSRASGTTCRRRRSSTC